ncbi:MAG: hypothetical protein K2I35_10420 [Duncaniella sp.]|nr:hypothetical protein [Duncaniella sp.]
MKKIIIHVLRCMMIEMSIAETQSLACRKTGGFERNVHILRSVESDISYSN